MGLLVIDTSILSFIDWSGLISKYTDITQQEYMKDYDMRSKESMRMRETEERVRNINATMDVSDGTLQISINNNDVPMESNAVWVENSLTIIRSLIQEDLYDQIIANADLFTDQIKQEVISIIGGVL